MAYASSKFSCFMLRRTPRSTLFPTRRSSDLDLCWDITTRWPLADGSMRGVFTEHTLEHFSLAHADHILRSEEHTSELQSRRDLVCRLLLEKKKPKTTIPRACC